MTHFASTLKTLFIRMNENMFQWKTANQGHHRTSKYNALIKYVREHVNCPIILIQVEYWKKHYPFRYEVFDLFFRQRKTLEYIRELYDFCDSHIIRQECKLIYATLEMPLQLNPVNETRYIVYNK